MTKERIKAKDVFLDEIYEFDTPITFVSCGRFEILGVIRDPGYSGDSDRLGRGLLKAMVRP